MSLALKSDDIFEIAIQIERNGDAFYTRAFERTGEDGLKECFARLAAEEREHANTFAVLKAVCGGKEGRGERPEDDAVSYLKAFARGHVFDPAENAPDSFAELRTPVDILKRAITAEKDAIALYTGIKAFIADDQCGRAKLERVIADEMNHIAELSDRLESLTASGGAD